MKKIYVQLAFLAAFSAFSFFQNAFSQPQWMHFTGSDGVEDFEFYDQKICVAGWGGLTKIDLVTGEIEHFNELEAGLGSTVISTMAVGSDGSVWAVDYQQPLTILRPDQTVELFEKTSDGLLIETVQRILPQSPSRAFLFGRIGSDWGWWDFDGGSCTKFDLPTGFAATTFDSNHAFLDSKNVLWLPKKGAVAKHDGSTWTVLDSTFFEANVHFYVAAEAKDGSIWLAGYEAQNSRIVLFRLENGQKTRIEGPTGERFSFRNNRRPLFFDPSGAAYLLSEIENELWKFDGSNWEKIELDALGFLMKKGWLQRIGFDDFGNLWATGGRFKSGLFCLKKGQSQFTKQENLGNTPVLSNRLGRVVINKSNEKYLASDDQLFRFDGQNWSDIVLPFKNDSSTFELIGASPKDGSIWMIDLQNNDGNWADATSFLTRFDGQNLQSFPIQLPDGGPIDFYDPPAFDEYGNLWFVDDYKLWKLDDSGQMAEQTDFPGTSEVSSMQVCLDKKGVLWVLGEKNMYRKEGPNWSVDPLEPLNPNYSDWGKNQPLYVTSDGIAYFLQTFDTELVGIFRFNPPTSLGFQVQPTPFDPAENANSSFSGYKILEDSSKNVWMIVHDYGLFKLDANGDWTWFNHKNSGFPSVGAHDMAIDANQNIWLTTSSGLVVFNENGIKKLGFGPNAPVFSSENVSISPSPASDQITLRLPIDWPNEPVFWQILNEKGESVLIEKASQTGVKTVSVEHFSLGAYFVQARSGDRRAGGKFLKL